MRKRKRGVNLDENESKEEEVEENDDKNLRLKGQQTGHNQRSYDNSTQNCNKTIN